MPKGALEGTEEDVGNSVKQLSSHNVCQAGREGNPELTSLAKYKCYLRELYVEQGRRPSSADHAHMPERVVVV